MELAEDYVETIADLLERKGEARVTEVAACLGVSHVTVIRTLGRLARNGLTGAGARHGIRLTPAGRALARRTRERHEIVVRFLEALGVSPRVARIDAEGIEHHVSARTLAAMARFAGNSPSPL